jgi:hypothetical protein
MENEMALTKEIKIDLMEIVGNFKHVQCREATIISEGGKELSRSFKRKILSANMDVSGEPQEVQDICNAVWTDEVKQAWSDFQAAQAAEMGG